MHKADMKLCVDVCNLLSRRSRATRAKVGSVLWDPKTRNIVSLGYNGTPEGEDNTMEANNKTLDTVIHAEVNVLRKIWWWHSRRCYLFVTHSPCINCAKMIVQKGIKRVYYLDNYGSAEGLQYLRASGVTALRLFVTQ
jgi:dCMP deaminase